MLKKKFGLKKRGKVYFSEFDVMRFYLVTVNIVRLVYLTFYKLDYFLFLLLSYPSNL